MKTVQKMLRGILVLFSMTFGITPPGSGQAPAPLSLDEAISAAQAHHPLIAGAAAEEEQARGSLKESRAALLPSVQVAEEALYSNDPVFAFGSKLRQGRFTSNDFALDALNHPSPISNFSASATSTWTAFDAGSARRKVDAAKESLTAAELSRRFTSEQLTTQVIALFFRVLTAEDQVAVAERTVNRASEIRESVGDRVRAGLALESDGARAGLGLLNAQDDLAAAKANIALARHDLFAAMDEPISNRPLLKPPVLSDSATDGEVLRVDPAQRTDLQALRMQQQAARQNLTAIKATAWPAITTFAHLENDAEHVVTNGSGNWMVGAKIQLNVFDGGLRHAREQETVAQLHGLEARERSTLLEARSTIASLRTEIEDLNRRLVTAEEAIRVQQEALQTSRDRYASGLVTLTDVLQNEAELTSAEFLRVRFFYELRIATAKLAFASGASMNSSGGRP